MGFIEDLLHPGNAQQMHMLGRPGGRPAARIDRPGFASPDWTGLVCIIVYIRGIYLCIYLGVYLGALKYTFWCLFWCISECIFRDFLRELAIDSATDWPLVQVPRERMDNFRDPVRAKSWSFCVWLLARHPEDWLDLCAALNKKNASQQDVDDLFAENLALDVAESEAEWRAWAQQNSAIGKASGWH